VKHLLFLLILVGAILLALEFGWTYKAEYGSSGIGFMLIECSVVLLLAWFIVYKLKV